MAFLEFHACIFTILLFPSFPPFSLVLFLVSSAMASTMATAKLTVNVLDVNDNTPRFRPFGVTYFTERILEGATEGTTLISISAVDPDKGANGQITYELLNLSPEGYACLEDQSAGRWPERVGVLGQVGGPAQVSHFRVCHPPGKVVANRTVDYEEVQWLNFTVRASDNGSPRRSAEIPVYLQIVDINDNNPVFSQPSYQVSWDPPSKFMWGSERTGTELEVPQGHLIFPLSVLELAEEDGQPTNALCANISFWGQLWPPLGATLTLGYHLLNQQVMQDLPAPFSCRKLSLRTCHWVRSS